MTDLTAPEHQHSEAVVQAAQWLSEQNPPAQPIISALRSRFDLSDADAAEAILLAGHYSICRRAFG